MKKIMLFLIMGLTTIAFTSCKEDVDPRDEFVGVYSFTQTGSATIYSNGAELGSVPMDGQGTMYCKKVGTGNQIRLSGDIVAEIDGVVSGNTLILNSITINGNRNGIKLQFTYTFQPATKNGNTVTCIGKINGVTSGQGMTGTISGNITLIAVKK